MKVGNDGSHLLRGHLIGKRRHHGFPGYEQMLNLGIGCRLAIRQCLAREQAAKIGRRRVQMLVIFDMAVRTALFKYLLPLRFQRRERRFPTVAAGKEQEHSPQERSKGDRAHLEPF